jgi:diketogulonate reductase-like aldo/keto reductase
MSENPSRSEAGFFHNAIIHYMQYETIHNLILPKIGFGTWSIGGKSSPDSSLDQNSLVALRTALEVGYTHFDTAEIYADGHSEELLGSALREMRVKRENVFITSKVEPSHLKYDQVLHACEYSLRRLQLDFLDLYLIHWPTARMKLEDTFRALNKLVREGKVKHLGVSNFNLKQLKQSQTLSETPIITNQVPYRLPDNKYLENGVVDYCQKNNILITAYSPVKFRSIRVNKILRTIAEANSATPHQIALAWLVMQPRVITIPMSFNPQHIKENFEAANIELTGDDMARLSNAWRE